MKTRVSNKFKLKAGVDMYYSNRQRGLTLVEIMVAMAIMLVVLSAVLLNVSRSTKAGSYQRNYSDVMESGQTALNMLARYIRNAGYQQLVEVPVYEKPRFGQSMMGCQDQIMSTTPGTIAAWGATCSGAASTSDSIAMRYQGGDELLSLPDSGATVSLATQDCAGVTVTGNTATLGDGSAATIIDNRFYIDNNGNLVCYGNGLNAPAVMVSGIQQMRFWYGVADRVTDANSGVQVLIPQVVQYLTAPELETKYAGESPDKRWEHVVSVRICVLASSAVGPGGVPAAATYTDCDGTPDIPMGNTLRRAMYTTVDVPNVGTGL